jgi:hypothetical protein
MSARRENRHAPPAIPSRLPLHLDRIGVEVRMQGLGVYAVVLADSEFQKVGDEELAK